MMHACNPRTSETEAGGMEGRWLHEEICIQKTNKAKLNHNAGVKDNRTRNEPPVKEWSMPCI